MERDRHGLQIHTYTGQILALPLPYLEHTLPLRALISLSESGETNRLHGDIMNTECDGT